MVTIYNNSCGCGCGGGLPSGAIPTYGTGGATIPESFALSPASYPISTLPLPEPQDAGYSDWKCNASNMLVQQLRDNILAWQDLFMRGEAEYADLAEYMDGSWFFLNVSYDLAWSAYYWLMEHVYNFMASGIVDNLVGFINANFQSLVDAVYCADTAVDSRTAVEEFFTNSDLPTAERFAVGFQLQTMPWEWIYAELENRPEIPEFAEPCECVPPPLWNCDGLTFPAGWNCEVATLTLDQATGAGQSTILALPDGSSQVHIVQDQYSANAQIGLVDAHASASHVIYFLEYISSSTGVLAVMKSSGANTFHNDSPNRTTPWVAVYGSGSTETQDWITSQAVVQLAGQDVILGTYRPAGVRVYLQNNIVETQDSVIRVLVAWKDTA